MYKTSNISRHKPTSPFRFPTYNEPVKIIHTKKQEIKADNNKEDREIAHVRETNQSLYLLSGFDTDNHDINMKISKKPSTLEITENVMTIPFTVDYKMMHGFEIPIIEKKKLNPTIPYNNRPKVEYKIKEKDNNNNNNDNDKIQGLTSNQQQVILTDTKEYNKTRPSTSHSHSHSHSNNNNNNDVINNNYNKRRPLSAESLVSNSFNMNNEHNATNNNETINLKPSRSRNGNKLNNNKQNKKINNKQYQQQQQQQTYGNKRPSSHTNSKKELLNNAKKQQRPSTVHLSKRNNNNEKTINNRSIWSYSTVQDSDLFAESVNNSMLIHKRPKTANYSKKTSFNESSNIINSIEIKHQPSVVLTPQRTKIISIDMYKTDQTGIINLKRPNTANNKPINFDNDSLPSNDEINNKQIRPNTAPLHRFSTPIDSNYNKITEPPVDNENFKTLQKPKSILDFGNFYKGIDIAMSKVIISTPAEDKFTPKPELTAAQIEIVGKDIAKTKRDFLKDKVRSKVSEMMKEYVHSDLSLIEKQKISIRLFNKLLHEIDVKIAIDRHNNKEKLRKTEIETVKHLEEKKILEKKIYQESKMKKQLEIKDERRKYVRRKLEAELLRAHELKHNMIIPYEEDVIPVEVKNIMASVKVNEIKSSYKEQWLKEEVDSELYFGSERTDNDLNDEDQDPQAIAVEYLKKIEIKNSFMKKEEEDYFNSLYQSKIRIGDEYGILDIDLSSKLNLADNTNKKSGKNILLVDDKNNISIEDRIEKEEKAENNNQEIINIDNKESELTNPYAKRNKDTNLIYFNYEEMNKRRMKTVQMSRIKLKVAVDSGVKSMASLVAFKEARDSSLRPVQRIFDQTIKIEKDALIDIYDNLNGFKWKKQNNWRSPSLPVGKWYGVITDIKFTITELHLANNNIKGQFPNELSYCVNLEVLILDDNDLTGVLPVEVLVHLKCLEVLSIKRNELTGKIPFQVLSVLPCLREIWLTDNEFDGPIHDTLGDCKYLTHLCLYNNNLIGPIPSWIGRNRRLKLLSLSNNNLEGKIPNSMIELKNLTHVMLSMNKLTGQVPNFFADLPKLKVLELYHNNFKGYVPISVEEFKIHLTKENEKDKDILLLMNDNLQNETIPASTNKSSPKNKKSDLKNKLDQILKQSNENI